MAAKFPVPTNK